MLDIRQIRDDPNAIEARLQTKEPSLSLAHLLAVDRRIREIKTQVEELKSERNRRSKEIGEKKRRGEETSTLMQEMGALGEEIAVLDTELKKLEEEFTHLISQLPNLPSPELKISQDPKDNVCIKEWGKKREFSFTPKNHVELNEQLHLFDFKRAAKVSGAGWPAYRGLGAQLEWALLNYMIQTHIKKGFTFWLPPLLVRPEVAFAAGQLPKFKTQLFQLHDEAFHHYLIPTAEMALNGLHMDEIFSEEQLPLKYASYTPCFRREAGAAGSAERGLIRMHQFNKVEMFCFATPEQTQQLFDGMIATAEELLQGLGLHYRLMLLVTGDSSFAASKTVDVEVYLPGQGRYYEVSSISDCTDYQARRSMIRYRNTKTERTEFVHTLNGSGLATSRLMVALLENNQTSTGSVKLPPPLAQALGRDELVP